MHQQIVRRDADDFHARLYPRRFRAFDLVAHGVELAEQIDRLERQDAVGLRNQGACALRLAKVMRVRHVHARAVVDHRRLQQLGEPYQIVHGALRTRVAIGDDHRRFGGHQHSGGFAQRVRIARGLRGHGQTGNFEFARLALLERIFLKLAVGDDKHRTGRLRARERITAHRRFGEMLQRHRIVVPFDEVAHGRRAILHAVEPFDAGPPLRERASIASKEQHRNTVAVGVVDRHRGVLRADGSVHDRGHRLARHLGVAMRHSDRHFLVQAGQPFRALVSPIIDETFLQGAEGRAGTGCDIIEVERLADVDHEVGAGLLGRKTFDLRWPIALFGLRRRARRWGIGFCGLRSLRTGSFGNGYRGSAGRDYTFEESTAVQAPGFRFYHGLSPCFFLQSRVIRGSQLFSKLLHRGGRSEEIAVSEPQVCWLQAHDFQDVGKRARRGANVRSLGRRKAALERIRRHDRLGASHKAVVGSGGCDRSGRRISCSRGHHGRLERRLGGSLSGVGLRRFRLDVGNLRLGRGGRLCRGGGGIGRRAAAKANLACEAGEEALRTRRFAPPEPR